MSAASETQVITKLVALAEQQPLVRAMILTSSRTSGVPVDRLSDYDVILVVADINSFVKDETWLWDFGKPLVMFRDSSSLHETTTYARLVLYDDGTKIDYTIWPVALLQRIQARPTLPDVLDVGYRVLVDKDSLTHGLKPPTYTAYIPPKPAEKEYQMLIEEFWWESTYVAKNLWRDELIHAKYNLDYVMKFQLLRKLLEWRIEIDHNWSLKPGATGRGLKKLLDPATWAAFAETYVGADIEENWEALFKTTALFRAVAIAVGDALGYAYLYDLDERVTRYLRSIRNAPSTS